MKYRKLRIAWSVGWSLIAVLLIVFWVRSYWFHERARTDLLGFAECWIEAFRGEFGISILKPCRNLWDGWDFLSHPVEEVHGFPVTMDDVNPIPRVFGIRFYSGLSNTYLFLPCWVPAALFSLLAGAVWIDLRFSLRALLIVITLASIGLGLAVGYDSLS